MSLHIFTHRICAAIAWPGYSSRAQLPLLGQHKTCYSPALCDVVVLMCYTQGFRNFMQELRSQGCKVLITSQCRLGGGLQSAEQLELRSLLPEHAADLLRQAAGAALAGVPQAKRLAFTCNHNALALTVIGGFIKSLVVTTEVCTCMMCVSWCKGSAQHSQIGFSAMTARAIAAALDRIAKRCPTRLLFLTCVSRVTFLAGCRLQLRIVKRRRTCAGSIPTQSCHLVALLAAQQPNRRPSGS